MELLKRLLEAPRIKPPSALQQRLGGEVLWQPLA